MNAITIQELMILGLKYLSCKNDIFRNSPKIKNRRGNKSQAAESSKTNDNLGDGVVGMLDVFCVNLNEGIKVTKQINRMREMG